MKDKLTEILERGKNVADALNAIEVRGYGQCKTLTNIVEAIITNNCELNDILINMKDENKE